MAAVRPEDANLSTRAIIWEHAKDVGFLLLCEFGIALALILIGYSVPDLQRMVSAIQPVLEVSAVATIGSLALETLARMFVKLWIELSGLLKQEEKESV